MQCHCMPGTLGRMPAPHTSPGFSRCAAAGPERQRPPILGGSQRRALVQKGSEVSAASREK